MPTPAKGYYTADGQRVPSVTTILSRFKDSGALLWWANRLAYDPYRQVRAILEQIVELGQVSPGLLADAKALLIKPADACDYKVARDTAAGIGTIVHARCDAYIRGKEVDFSVYRSDMVVDPQKESQAGFNAFLEWAGSTSFKLAEGEIQLVSQTYRYGGTPDVVLVRGEPLVGDWKSGDLYAEQVIPQLAAYRALLLENGRTVGAGGHAISINKKTGGFVHRYFTPEEMERGWKVFWRMRELYDLVKELK